ncbi:MAG: carboxymuconolactone decarboxylase family protein [Betaproteobacteria bacterium]|nr:carboxymuconolactone decarboxylase family protein [Betaproteobacteria bacterium]
MSDLTPRDLELVALGAAMGSNCAPCVEYHIPESRKAGLTDPEIHAAIRHADKIRQVPARKTLQTALKLLPSAADDVRTPETAEGCGCGAGAEVAKAETGKTAQPRDMMAMMSKMMDICAGHGQSAAAPNSAEKKPAVNPAASEGCGCG